MLKTHHCVPRMPCGILLWYCGSAERTSCAACVIACLLRCLAAASAGACCGRAVTTVLASHGTLSMFCTFHHAGEASVDERLRKHVRAVLGDDGGGQRWRLTSLSGRPASGVASATGAAFQHVRRAAMETLAPGQARLMSGEAALLMQTSQPCIPACVEGWLAMPAPGQAQIRRVVQALAFITYATCILH